MLQASARTATATTEPAAARAPASASKGSSPAKQSSPARTDQAGAKQQQEAQEEPVPFGEEFDEAAMLKSAQVKSAMCCG